MSGQASTSSNTPSPSRSGPGAGPRLRIVRMPEAHLLRLPGKLDAQAHARGPGCPHVGLCKARLGGEPEEGQAAGEIEVAAFEADEPLEGGDAAELEAILL